MDHSDLLRDVEEFHLAIKNFEFKATEKFLESGIVRCGHCKATGVKGGKDINHACTHCMGVGYICPTELGGCPHCNASGKKLEYQNHVTECPTCEGEGRLDWVDAIRKGVELEEIGW